MYLEKKNINNQIYEIETKIKKITKDNKELVVSEHALLRYIEKFKGLSLDLIRKEIITDKVIENHKIIGDGTYHNGDVVMIIKNNTVITILD